MAQRVYSQHGEQQFIEQYFAIARIERGRMLDIGAADGMTFSNTRALIERGWGGTLVEPSPFVFPKLLEHSMPFMQSGSLVSVNAAIAQLDALAPWFDSGGDMLSTLSREHRDLWAGPDGRVPFKHFMIPTISWQTLLKSCPGPYEFVNIDVEGTNFGTLMHMPLDLVCATLICVEHSPTIVGEHDRMIELMRSRSYKLVQEIGPNLFFDRVASEFIGGGA